MDKRIKNLEIELSYLRKELKELKEEKVVEIHNHYTYDYSNMKPMIINDLKGLNDFTNNMDNPPFNM